MIHYLGVEPIQNYGSGLIKLLSLATRLIFAPNRAFPPLLGATASNFTQVPNVMAAPLSIPASNAAAAILSHDAPKLDHGKSQANLMNSQILPTPVIATKLDHYLKGYDHILRDKIIKGFTQGFKLEFVGERKSSFAPNLLSAREFPEVIDSKVASEVALGRIAGPFNSPPVDPLWVSPVGVVTKKIKGEYRMIQHLSYPEGRSVNDGIPQEFSTVHCATVDDAISLIKRCGRGSALAKTDIKSAFRIIPVHPSDYQLLGFHWKGKWYVDRCLPMGCSSSCRIFEEFSSSLEWIARHKLGIENIIHILDDFLIIDQSQ